MASSTIEAVRTNVVSHAEWLAARTEFLKKKRKSSRGCAMN